jgi:type IV pilus assembly protein PilB
MPITREVKDLVLQSASPAEICKVARDQGMKTLRESALQKMLAGVTTLEEILRVTAE